MPICVSFAFFDVGTFMVIDPSEREELVANGAMVVAMNKHREICLLQMTGDMLLLQEQASVMCCCLAFCVMGIKNLFQL
jgi:exosome complex component RRP45